MQRVWNTIGNKKTDLERKNSPVIACVRTFEEERKTFGVIRHAAKIKQTENQANQIQGKGMTLEYPYIS